MRWPRFSADILSLLTLLSPIIGILTTLTVRCWNSSLVRPMSISNSLMTLLLACATVMAQIDLEQSGRESSHHLSSALRWLTMPNSSSWPLDQNRQGVQIRLAVGCDGLSAWSALALSLVVWSAICSCSGRDPEFVSSQCLRLMAGHALLLASLFATDAVVGILLLEAALFPFYLLVGQGTEGGCRAVAGSFWNWQVIGCTISLMAVTMLAVAQPWMQSDLVPSRGAALFDSSLLADSLRQLLVRSESAWHLWSLLAPWAAALMLLGLLVRLPLFPFLGWHHSVLVSALPLVGAVISAGFPLVALIGWLRLGLPLFAVHSSAVIDILSFVSIVSAIQATWRLQAAVDLKRIVALQSCTLLSISGVSLGLQSEGGIVAAWLLVFMQALVVSSGMQVVHFLQERSHALDISHLSEVVRNSPRLRVLLAVQLILPIVSGTAAFTLMLMAATMADWWLISGLLIALGLNASGVIRNLAGVIGSFRQLQCPIRDYSNDVTATDLARMTPMLALILVLNVTPTLATSSVESVVQKLMRRSVARADAATSVLDKRDSIFFAVPLCDPSICDRVLLHWENLRPACNL